MDFVQEIASSRRLFVVNDEDEDDEESSVTHEEDEEEDSVAGQRFQRPSLSEFRTSNRPEFRPDPLSLWALRVSVLSAGICSSVLTPSYPFLTQPEALPSESFPSIPFGWAASTHFLGLARIISKSFASVALGALSDRIGRRPCLMLCLLMNSLTTVAKVIVGWHSTYWGFVAANFCNGLFAGTLPIALAYVSDKLRNRRHKDGEITIILSLSAAGAAAGRVLTVLTGTFFGSYFASLWFGVGGTFIAFCFVALVLKEPHERLHISEWLSEIHREPTKLRREFEASNRKWVIPIIMIGSLLDNVGTTGLLPLALTPLALQEFSTHNDEGISDSSVMSIEAFQWIVVAVTTMAILGTYMSIFPQIGNSTSLIGAVLSKNVFRKVGVAGGCVLGNATTGLAIVGCLGLAKIDPASRASYGGFVAFLLLSVPFTVFSTMSTGPMLDRVVKKKGLWHGANYSLVGIGRGASAWLFGVMADGYGIVPTLWTTMGLSLFAAVVNTPLVFLDEMGPSKESRHPKSKTKTSQNEPNDKPNSGQELPR